MRIGYMRVSVGRGDDGQRTALLAAGVAERNIYVDHTAGAKSSRPQWDWVLGVLAPGDVLVCTRLDRVGRSIAHLVEVLEGLHRREVGVRVIEQGIDTTTREGQLTWNAMTALAEFQRDLLVASTHEGLAAARSRGRTGGRRPKLSADQALLAQRLYRTREKTVAQIAAEFDVPRSTIYGYLKGKPAQESTVKSTSDGVASGR